MKKSVRKITLAGALLAIIIIFQLLKNISAFISGPVINAAMVIATIELGIWWGVGFCIGVPLLSLLIAPASPMSLMGQATYGTTVLIIIVGNIILCLFAYFFRNKKIWLFTIALIIGALLKWLEMWGGASLIIKPLFEEELGKLIAAVEKVFSLLQLYSGLLSVVLIVPLRWLFKRKEKDNN